MQGQEAKEERFEKVDPYTRGDAKAIERSGYIVAYAPFGWAEQVRTTDVAEAMGGGDVLWLETTHFKIGSTLPSYRLNIDTREEKALDTELQRLKSRLAGYQPPRNRLDPWLRVHLYALRLEDVYEKVTRQLGFAGGDEPISKGAPAKHSASAGDREPPQKIRILLAGKSSSLGRYLKHFADREPRVFDRYTLPGGAQFLGVNEEDLRATGYDLDIALHCVVAGGIVHNLIEGFTGAHGMCPLWFEYGLDHVITRGIDERYPATPLNTIRLDDESSFRWESRVRGLVVNGVAPSWSDTASWRTWEEIKSSGHLVAWSRVQWLLKRKPAELRAFVTAISGPASGGSGESMRTSFADQSAAAKAAFGKSLEELEIQWKKQASR